jgi:hypothetical protein
MAVGFPTMYNTGLANAHSQPPVLDCTKHYFKKREA